MPARRFAALMLVVVMTSCERSPKQPDAARAANRPAAARVTVRPCDPVITQYGDKAPAATQGPTGESYLTRTLPTALGKDGGPLATCYAQARAKDPLAGGVALLRVEVGATGSIASTSSNLLEDCLRQTLTGTQVPPPPAELAATCFVELVPASQPLVVEGAGLVLAPNDPPPAAGIADAPRLVIKAADDSPAADVAALAEGAYAERVADIRLAHGRAGAYTVIPALLRAPKAPEPVAVALVVGSDGVSLRRGDVVQPFQRDAARLTAAVGDPGIRRGLPQAGVTLGPGATVADLALALDVLTAAGWSVVLLGSG